MIETEIYYDFNEIENTAEKFLEATAPNKLFAFSGDLGAGKTTFITALCKILGVTETVTSPTYSIIQEYTTRDKTVIFHIDLYRIKGKEEAVDAGVEDCLMSNDICMVEWPERASQIFPEQTIYTTIEILFETKRKLVIQLPA